MDCPNPESCIETRAADYPLRYKATYRKAMAGKSRKAAMTAFCVMCMGYQAHEVKRCTAPACPLYPYRGALSGTT